MANWGSCEFDELLGWALRIESDISSQQFQRFCEQCANEIADELLRRLKKVTPVGDVPIWAVDRIIEQQGYQKTKGFNSLKSSAKLRMTKKLAKMAGDGRFSVLEHWTGYQGGHLRRSWEVQPVKKTGDAYEVEVVNFAPYASYVEFGHRQTPGRYVPALGVTLKKPWVKGQRFMTTEEEKMRGQIQAVLDKKLSRFLTEAFSKGGGTGQWLK